MIKNLKEKIEEEFSKINDSEDQKDTLNSLKPLFIDYLRNIDSKEREYFTTAIQITVSYYISDKKLARLCKTAPGTISRWANGISAPSYIARPSILRLITEQLE